MSESTAKRLSSRIRPMAIPAVGRLSGTPASISASDVPPSELAMSDLAPTGRAEPSGLADRERREVIMEQERLLVGTGQGIHELLVFTGAEGRHRQRLSFAAGEQ